MTSIAVYFHSGSSVSLRSDSVMMFWMKLELIPLWSKRFSQPNALTLMLLVRLHHAWLEKHIDLFFFMWVTDMYMKASTYQKYTNYRLAQKDIDNQNSSLVAYVYACVPNQDQYGSLLQFEIIIKPQISFGHAVLIVARTCITLSKSLIGIKHSYHYATGW